MDADDDIIANHEWIAGIELHFTIERPAAHSELILLIEPSRALLLGNLSPPRFNCLFVSLSCRRCAI